MSNRIPNDPPKSHQISQEEEKSQQSNLPSQIERRSISPSLSQEKPDVEKMTSSVKGERKRKKEETEEKEKELKPSQQVEKKRDLIPESKKIIEELHKKVSECLEPIPENIDGLGAIAEFCFEKIKDRVRQPEHLRTEEISKIYELLFDTELRSICESILSEPFDPTNPHPAQIFKALYDCVKALEAYPSFKEASDAREKYFDSNQMLGRYLGFDSATRERILPLILDQVPNFEDTINKCPVYTARDLFGGHNIHTVYVLRGTDYEQKFIFKPTLELIQEGTLFPLNSNDPYELNIKEHVAHILNFHSQFPIPAVFLVEIKGYVGSVQPFIGKPLKIDGSNSFQMPVRDLQAILVYDLLFSNCDRHIDNLLAKKEQDGFHVYGIDHDSCMSFDNRPLKMDYLEFAHAFNCPFEESIKSLVSEENITRYKTIMAERKMPPEAIKWMEYVGMCLRNACDSKESAQLTAKKLMSEFEKKHVI